MRGKLLTFEFKKATKSEGGDISLKDCFEQFSKLDSLVGENKWYCNKCKEQVEATKKMEIYKIPPVLILCLQRFKESKHSMYYAKKMEDLVEFPIEGLDMSPYVLNEDLKQISDLKYDLVAVSNHFGTLTGGHYTAFCKSPDSGEWNEYNDSNVSKVYNNQSIVSRSAYVLYYVRKDFFPDGDINYSSIKNSIQGYDLETGMMD
jgi:ubiquitin C-terminal hydrolase